MSFDRLAPGVQRWIEYHDWKTFTPIQSQAIPQILEGGGALLIAPTASGKTEAAILPVISEIKRLGLVPIAMLYISPLRALINDQTRRAQNLLEENGLEVAWWHGDLSSSQRRKVLAAPPHALLTTPESLEVMLSSDSYGHGALLGNVHFLLIDEIHAFVEDDRGTQLVSLLNRLEVHKRTPLTRIALSATVTNPHAVVEWMRSPRLDAPAIRVLSDPGEKARRIGVGYVGLAGNDADETATRADQRKLVSLVRKHVEGKRAIVFVNSRAEAENLTFHLREAQIEAMVHHGSIHKEERQRVESAFRQEGPRVVVATSTLELGIDIGDLDLVLQLGPPSSASSLLQRLGRSGRAADAASVCIMYAKSLEEIPVTLGVAELAGRGHVEELYPRTASVHVLFHQVLQLLRERVRADEAEIAEALLGAGAFRAITDSEFGDLLSEMLQMHYLERERDWLRLGPMTEKQFGRMNYRDFYAVFEPEIQWTVRTDKQVIGTIDRRYPVAKDCDTFLILGGRAWRIKSIDQPNFVLLVEPAKRIAVPKWHSLGPGPSFDVMQAALEIVCGRRGPYESPALSEKLAPQRADAANHGYEPGVIQLELCKEHTTAITYFGSTVNAYLATLLIGAAGVDAVRATPTTVQYRGAGERVRRELELLLVDPAARAQALEAALPRLSQVQIGRFWPMFGPKTRGHVLRRFYETADPYFERIAEMPVRLPQRSVSGL